MFDMSDDDSFFYDSYEPYNMDGGEFVPNDAPDDFDPFDETYLETPEQVEKGLTELESIKMWYDGNERKPQYWTGKSAPVIGDCEMSTMWRSYVYINNSLGQ